MKKLDILDWILVLLIVASIIALFVYKHTEFYLYGVFISIIGTSIVALLRGRVSKTIYYSSSIITMIFTIVWAASIFLKW